MQLNLCLANFRKTTFYEYDEKLILIKVTVVLKVKKIKFRLILPKSLKKAN